MLRELTTLPYWAKLPLMSYDCRLIIGDRWVLTLNFSSDGSLFEIRIPLSGLAQTASSLFLGMSQ